MYLQLYSIQTILRHVTTSAGSILIEIEESTILAQFFRIEIVKESILEYLPESAKIEIEQFWNRPSSSLFFGIKAKKHNFLLG